MIKLDKFFTSGFDFEELELNLKARFQMINVALILSSLALLYGATANAIRGVEGLIEIEIFLTMLNISMIFILRRDKKYFQPVANLVTGVFTLFFLFLIYTSAPSELRHIWLFTYPIVLLYFQKTRSGIYWFVFLVSALLILPFQTVVEVQYAPYQIFYILVVLFIIAAMIAFYQAKMTEARELIIVQQHNLESKIQELEKKDELLTIQSKQAVMGEMITMIAHQWRQPLSTITLQISNLEVRKLLGEKITQEETDKTFTQINNSVIYLSETINDFQTYFHPQKESNEIEVHKLLDKTINFILPRLKDTTIELRFDQKEEIIISTYTNELIQVILNIFNNAIDAMSELQSDKSVLKIDIEKIDKDIVVSISDNAGGISKSDLPYIFEPYFSTKGKNGTGLGLYMSQIIVQKQLGGDISVETSTKGTTFKVRFLQTLVK